MPDTTVHPREPTRSGIVAPGGPVARSIDVVIPAVSASPGLERAIRSVLATGYRDFTVHVVDQSQGEPPAAPLPDDPRVRRHRIGGRGLAAALNHGAAIGDGDLIAFTADDCTVDHGWLDAIAGAFADGAGVVFGSVEPGRAHPGSTFVPACVVTEEAAVSSLRGVHRLDGTTSCMAVRRSTWERLGGFDERFGLGARFRSGEDIDLALRALLDGETVRRTPRVRVTHHSACPVGERDSLVRRNWYGSGAAFGKSARRAPLATAAALSLLGVRWAGGGSAVAASYGRTRRWSMLVAFASGFAAGLRAPAASTPRIGAARPRS